MSQKQSALYGVEEEELDRMFALKFVPENDNVASEVVIFSAEARIMFEDRSFC